MAITLIAVGKQIYLAAKALYCGTSLLELEAMRKTWLLLLLFLLFFLFFFRLDVTVHSARSALHLAISYRDMVLFRIFLFGLILLFDRFERVVFRSISFFMMGRLGSLKMLSFLSFGAYVSLRVFNRALSFKDLCSCAVLRVSAL